MSNDVSTSGSVTYVFDPLGSSIQTSSIIDDLFEGSRFRPLRLTGHPWVRAYGRDVAVDQETPRLSFLTRHIYLHGPESLLLIQEDGLVATQICGERNSLALDLEDSDGSSTITPPTPTCAAEPQPGCTSPELLSNRLHVASGKQTIQSLPCSPVSSPPPTPPRLSQSAPETPHRRCRPHLPEIGERSSSSALSVAEFGGLFAGTISTANGIFGLPDSPTITRRGLRGPSKLRD